MVLWLADEARTVEPWPRRLLAPSPRLSELGISESEFRTDTVSSGSSVQRWVG